MKKSSKNILTAVVVLVLLLGAYHILFPPPIPDDQQIASAIKASAAAAQNKDVGGLMRPVSDQFVDANGITGDQLRYMLGRNIHYYNSITVTVSSTSVKVSGDTATSESFVTIDAVGESGSSFKFHGPIHFEWKKEPGTRLLIIPTQIWRVQKTDTAFGSFD